MRDQTRKEKKVKTEEKKLSSLIYYYPSQSKNYFK